MNSSNTNASDPAQWAFVRPSYTSEGMLVSGFLSAPHPLELKLFDGLPAQVLQPLFEVKEGGRRAETPMHFYPSAGLRSLPLQKRTWVETPVGSLPAELLIMYPSGSLRRIFPSAGRLTGFWTEELEFAQEPFCELHWGSHVWKARFISIGFHPNGNLQSLCLWPGEQLEVLSPLGLVTVRSGVSFHPDGSLRSVEPADPWELVTPLGSLMAFDNDPLGLVGDVNSVQFDLEGRLVALKTLSHGVKVFAQETEPQLFSPVRMPSFCEETASTWVPLSIQFGPDWVQFGEASCQRFGLNSTVFERIPCKAQARSVSCSS